jgi:hypothetical protein
LALTRLVIFLVLTNPLLRYIVGAGAVLLAISFSYTKGRTDCAVKQAVKRAEAAEQWAASVADGLEKAYQRGAESVRIDAENDNKVKEIANEAAKELGADDECLSAATVERLRELR